MGNNKSGMYTGIGIGAAALGICVGIGSCVNLIGGAGTSAEAIRARAEARALDRTPIISQKDLDGNAVPETFYEIDDVKYFSTVNGKLVEDMLGDSSLSK